MNLLEHLISLHGEEKGKELYKSLGLKKDFETIVQDKKNPTYVTKQELEEEKQKVTDLKKQVKKNDDDLKALKEQAKDNEELKTKIETLEKENKEISENSNKAVEELKYNFALDNALKVSGARDEVAQKAIRGFLEEDKIVLSDGKLLGIEEQLTKIKTSAPYLFAEEGGQKPQGTGNLGGKSVPVLNNTNSGNVQKSTEDDLINKLVAKRKATTEDLDKFLI